MRRREVIALIAGATAAWPLVARTETSRRVGLLFTPSAQAAKALGSREAIVQGLKEHGWVEGQNITFEYRYADGKQDALPKLAAELVRLRVDAIVAEGTPAMQAAKDATQTVPIVGLSNDPLASGFVSSLGRPGGNITGIGLLSADLAGRRLQLLSEVVVGLARVIVLLNPANPSHFALLKQTQAAGPSLMLSAFATISAAQTGAVIVLLDAMFFEYRRVVAFAATERLPTLYPEKQSVEAGGFIAYGPSIPAAYRQLATYLDKILRGADPAELPVEQPTTFEFAINLKTAKALGLSIPDKLLYTADEVIE